MSERILVADIQRVVEETYGLPPKSMAGERGTWKVSHPRQIAYYLSRKLTKKTYPVLGRLFNRDHSTVVFGVQQARRRIARDPELRDQVETIKERLAGDNPPLPTFCDDLASA
jgi:chromosomal replication initiator protein